MEDLLNQVPKVKGAENSFTQVSQNLESFDKELQESMKSKKIGNFEASHWRGSR